MQSKRNEIIEETKDEELVKEPRRSKSIKDAVRKYSRCPICDSNLHFSYNTDFNLNTTHETVKCPECAIRIRRVLHRLQ